LDFTWTGGLMFVTTFTETPQDMITTPEKKILACVTGAKKKSDRFRSTGGKK
jgi:hypothetical protein